ncbi:alpha/beta hydrolase [Pseudonocardia sp. C8]|uniref:alpha/beta hydrolase n=1 Tax=Pseudonocardia sp. C8 TaxID=2762759 RepID=UPI001642602E|nr:alpha/beta hydrolase [Pseudonocardia sp. C8]MBC3193746.1 alpha/beta hydrolase [Pseudonocardia sp. C8]
MTGTDVTAVPRPPFDPELELVLTTMSDEAPLVMTAEMIPLVRENPPFQLTEADFESLGLVVEDVTVPGYQGDEILVSVVKRKDHHGPGPGIFYTHGGGMITGDRFASLQLALPWVVDHDAVVVTVEYRLAPEFPDPVPVEDCYAGLVWAAGNARALDFDPERLMIAGTSAGGGLAAGVSLLARDRNGPHLIGQVLSYPMLDDRDRTVSSVQMDGVGMWDRQSNRLGWTSLLGDRRGTDAVSVYAAPARATDLSGLPPAYIDCGSAEVFRDEDVAYASALWAAGVQAELHVWPGGFHGFDLMAPESTLGKAMIRSRNAWVGRLLGG